MTIVSRRPARLCACVFYRRARICYGRDAAAAAAVVGDNERVAAAADDDNANGTVITH